VSFWRAGLDRLMIKIKTARRKLTDDLRHLQLGGGSESFLNGAAQVER